MSKPSELLQRIAIAESEIAMLAEDGLGAILVVSLTSYQRLTRDMASGLTIVGEPMRGKL